MERREPSRESLLGRTRLAKSGGCLNRTVPILRTAPCDPKSISRPSTHPTAPAVSPNDDQPIHQFVMLQSAFGQDYGVFGAVGDLSIWEPQVAAAPGEFSVSKIALYSGPDVGTVSESIEAGWIGENEQACFNTMCPGFVQTSQTVMLGQVLKLSVYDQSEVRINLSLHKPNSGKSIFICFSRRCFDWHRFWFLPEHLVQEEDGDWLVHVDDEAVGYWPVSLFTWLSRWANGTMMGGEVYDTFPGGQQTTTQMGNSLFPMEHSTNHRKAACIFRTSYMDADGHVRLLEDPISILITSPNCYSDQGNREEEGYWYDEYGICFGGPGLSSSCR
ncbi:hypothetical protein EJ110_NYTH60252 [Nymphaea thermarum]|nr:hypothetical protein EJ110_NYTH60252 [Nymphaea thermarum]